MVQKSTLYKFENVCRFEKYSQGLKCFLIVKNVVGFKIVCSWTKMLFMLVLQKYTHGLK
jgi:hypothetical protein